MSQQPRPLLEQENAIDDHRHREHDREQRERLEQRGRCRRTRWHARARACRVNSLLAPLETLYCLAGKTRIFPLSPLAFVTLPPHIE